MYYRFRRTEPADGRVTGVSTEDMLLTMLYKIRDCFAKINVYGRDKGVNEEQTDIGIRLTQALEDEILRTLRGGCDLNLEKCATENGEWHRLTDGDYPSDRETVLFATTSGQIFEGYMSKHDVFHPCVVDGKIAFPRHETGWGWYRYRFRDFLPPSCVTEWRYKPTPEKDARGATKDGG